MALSSKTSRLVLVAALLLWCVALVAIRVKIGGQNMYVFLLWNLFLAAIPLAAGAALDFSSSAISKFKIVLQDLPNANR